MIKQTVVVLCTVLSLALAVPHHEWHWTHPDTPHTQEHAWHWRKPSNSGVQKYTASSQAAEVVVEDVCKSVIGKLSDSVRRSVHVCENEISIPDTEGSGVTACYFTTATCCAGEGLPVSSKEVTVATEKATVTYYSVSNGTELCFTISDNVRACNRRPLCLSSCIPPDQVCLNQTLTGSVDSCENGVCQCMRGYAPRDCCKCAEEEGFIKVDGVCKEICIRDCEDRNGNTCEKCREGYLEPTCCKCAPGYYKHSNGSCISPCRNNTVSCTDGVCECKDGFGGLGCCQCRSPRNAILSTCSDEGCKQCQDGYVPTTCCECDDDYFKAADGSCNEICTTSALDCDINGCTKCADGYTGLDCCLCDKDYYRSNDETCLPPCPNNTVSCTDGVCKCKDGFGGPDCCQCRKNAILSTCSDAGCKQCQAGYDPTTCCECDDDYYGKDDGTCERPCPNNFKSCTGGVCECKDGFGGPDCCQCRKNADESSCSATGCERCVNNYAPKMCCECAEDTYIKDGSCAPICVETARKETCTINGCTECIDGYSGLDCCTPSCDGIQDIYFLLDTTNSNYHEALCETMYTVQLITAAVHPGQTTATSRIGGYVYPKTNVSPSADSMRLFKVGTKNCQASIQIFDDVNTGFIGSKDPASVRGKLGATNTYPSPAIVQIREDIESEIQSGVADKSRRRIVVILTDGASDGTVDELKTAVQNLVNAGNPGKITLIAGGIASEYNADAVKREEFRDQLLIMANGNSKNAILGMDTTELGVGIVQAMRDNGAICADEAKEIIDTINEDGSLKYCACTRTTNLLARSGCIRYTRSYFEWPQFCRTSPSPCPLCPGSTPQDLEQCAKPVQCDTSNSKTLEQEILAAVENVLMKLH